MTNNVENDISMKMYLLGELAEPQQLELEQGMMTSNERFDRLLVAEDELVDEYLGGTLSAREEKKFDDYFLCAPGRRRKLRFFRSLRRYICSHSTHRFWRWPEFLTFRPFPHRIIEGSLAAALSIMVLGGSWLTFRMQHLDHLLQQVRSQTVPASERESLQQQLAQLRGHNDQLASEVRVHKGQRAELELELAALRTSTTRPSSPYLIPFAFTSGTVRSGGEMKKVTIPPFASWVQLQLDLGVSDYEKYQVVLQKFEGEGISTQIMPKIKTGNDAEAVVLALPAKFLPHGDYVLKLSGIPAVGDPENIGSYTFRVLQK
jgi:cell division protein FtsB